MTRLILRADASSAIGNGHVMRCLTLATALRERGAHVTFVCRLLPGHLCDLLEQRGFAVRRLPAAPFDWRADAAQTLAAIGAEPADWLVADHYGIERRWEGALRAAARRIMVIDDLADRDHDCDLLLDQNLVADGERRYAGRVDARCPRLLGPRYALLQPAYAALHARLPPRAGPVRRLLAFFGGADQTDLSGKTLAAFIALQRADVELDLVAAGDAAQLERLRGQAAPHPNIHVHAGLPTLAGLMAKADLAVGAGGATTWERLCLGLPALVVTLADNQRAPTEELHRQGLVRWLGDAAALAPRDIEQALRESLARDLDPDWSRRCQRVVDGHGARRVASVLLLGADDPLPVRHATPDDEALLLEWANDPLTRSTAFSPRPIPAATHHAWLGARLRDIDGCRLYIVEAEPGLPLGQVRFERGAAEWEVHYALAPLFRGRGLGLGLLRGALAHFGAEFPRASVLGQVQPHNLPSRKLFEALGFAIQVLPDSGTLQYRRRLDPPFPSSQ